MSRRFRLRGEAVIILTFVALILIGTLLLSLPFATVGRSISLIDAVFTATSAACVTGLIVVDTGSYFTHFGQITILLLIQVGGLGIITLSSFFLIVLGKRMPLKQRDIVRQTHSSIDASSFLKLVGRIVLFTVAFEAIGATLLFLSWAGEFSLGEAIYQSVFHSISAFCNSGFSLFSQSLIPFQTNYAVNLVVMALIFVGGIGFLVIYDVERLLVYRMSLSLHSRLVLYGSLALIVAGTSLFFILEYDNVLAGFSLPHKVLISLFQSVTPRTAGFNTVDYGDLTNSTLILTLILMFIGGSPGSTAGGIKTTTLMVLMAMAYNRSQGRTSTNAFRRTIPEKNVNETLAIVLISIGILILFNFTLQWTEMGAIPHTETAGSFMETHFEAVSAFGTVGLSTGGTSRLSFWGKVQIILLMLIGRVGPLTIAVVIGRRQLGRVQYEYYKENVMVG